MVRFLNHSQSLVEEVKIICTKSKVLSLEVAVKDFEELYRKIEYGILKIDSNKFFFLETEAISSIS